MGFLISINGADFEPYQKVLQSAPLVSPVKPTQAALEPSKVKDSEKFHSILQESLNHNKKSLFNYYHKQNQLPSSLRSKTLSVDSSQI